MYEKLQNMIEECIQILVVVNYLHSYICRHTHLYNKLYYNKNMQYHIANIAGATSKCDNIQRR